MTVSSPHMHIAKGHDAGEYVVLCPPVTQPYVDDATGSFFLSTVIYTTGVYVVFTIVT